VAFSRRFRLALAAVLIVVGDVVAALGAVSAGSLPGDGSSRWKLVWQDEFDGAAGTAPDSGKWTYDVGCSGWGNSELECYTKRSQNVSLDGSGRLRIIARHESYQGRDYTSGRILSKGLFARTYGRFEARMKIPSGQGMWPAFWMLGTNIDSVGWSRCGEIDVMEAIGREPATVFGSMHGPGYDDGPISTAYTLTEGVLADDYHLYAVEWSPKGIAWYLDGVRYAWKTPRALPREAPWAFDHPFFLIFNLAIGGEWPGPPDSSTVFPTTLLVDYVRVYKRSGLDTEAPNPPAWLRVVKRGTTKVTLAWNVARDDVGTTRYVVLRGRKRVASTAKTRFVLHGLRPGNSYLVRVLAFDAAGNRSAAAQVEVHTRRTTPEQRRSKG